MIWLSQRQKIFPGCDLPIDVMIWKKVNEIIFSGSRLPSRYALT